MDASHCCALLPLAILASLYKQPVSEVPTVALRNTHV